MGELVRKMFFVMAIVFVALISDKCRANERAKRFLVYPEAAPTRVQVSYQKSGIKQTVMMK